MTEHPMTEATPLASEQITQEADELEALIGKATDCDLADEGRYFSETCNDLTSCRHGETGEYNDQHDGPLVEFLWNHRHHYLSLLRSAALSATPAPSDQDASQAQGEVAYPAAAIGALTGHQRQIDSDGTFVGVSRQALDEVLAYVETRPAPGATAQDGERKWFPHLDFAGEPMQPGQFREPYPMPEETPTPTIPAGMVAHTGRYKPDDWNGGKVLLKDMPGSLSGAPEPYLYQPEGVNFVWDNQQRPHVRVIAYTPLAAAPKQAEQQGVERDTVAFVQYWLMNAGYDPTQFDRDFAAAIDARAAQASEPLIKAMVSRFLAWKLPADFAPDAGITYCPPAFLAGEARPTGTNLFTAAQAEGMVRDMLAAALSPQGLDAKEGGE